MAIKVKRTFDILDRSLKEYPRKDAIGGKKNGKWYTYSTKEYYEKSHQFAIGLLVMGLNRGDKILTISTNCPEWNFLDMGMAMTGVIHVPVYPNIGKDELSYILQHSEARMIIVGNKKLFKKVQSIGYPAKIYSLEKIEGVSNYEEIIELGRINFAKYKGVLKTLKNSISATDLVTLIYTSGTTGIPKGVMLSHENIVYNFIGHSKMQDLGINHTAVSFLPLCHVYERSMNYHFQYKGMAVFYIGSLSQIGSSIKEIKPHMFNSVPRVLEKIYEGFIAKGKKLKGVKKRIYFWALELTRSFEYNKKFSYFEKLKIRIADKFVYSKWREALGGNITYIVSGGAALNPDIARVFGMARMYVIEGYGLSETSPVIAVNNPSKGELKIGTVGPVLNGTVVKIADDGEILCKGPGVMMGYYKAGELTKRVIDNNGFFHTGDIGFLEDERFLKITDRKKEIFKLSGGKYIAPQMIENMLKTSHFIEEAIVIGADEKFASALISPNFSELQEWCQKNKIFCQSNESLVRLPQVVEKVQMEVNGINRSLGSHERIGRIRLVCDEWSTASGELSPTLKLKRKVVIGKYQKLIDEIYSVGKN